MHLPSIIRIFFIFWKYGFDCHDEKKLNFILICDKWNIKKYMYLLLGIYFRVYFWKMT